MSGARGSDAGDGDQLGVGEDPDLDELDWVISDDEAAAADGADAFEDDHEWTCDDDGGMFTAVEANASAKPTGDASGGPRARGAVSPPSRRKVRLRRAPRAARPELSSSSGQA